MKITILSGGTGNDALYKGIKHYYNGADIKIIVNAYDSGKSTGICRKITNTLGVSDIRKNHSRLYSISNNFNQNLLEFLENRYNLDKDNEENFIYDKLSQWGIKNKKILDSIKYFFKLYKKHDKNYDFYDFNIANIVYSAMFNKYGYEKTCKIMTKFLGIEDNVILNSFDNVYIKAKTENNNIINDEGNIVDYKNANDKIVSILYNNNNIILNKKAIDRVLNSDLIIISSGTFWSSLYPTLDYGDFFKYINNSSAKKIIIMNNEQDKDAYGVSSNDFLNIYNNLGLDLSKFTIIENNDADEILKQKNNNYNIKYYSLGNINGKHDKDLISKCILKEYYNIKNNLVFDFDDTLWSRDWEKNKENYKISIENIKLLNNISNKYNIFILSGNSYDSIYNKLTLAFGTNVDAFNINIIADCNSTLYIKNKRIDICDSFIIDNNLINYIKKDMSEGLNNLNVSVNSSNTCIKIRPIEDYRRKSLAWFLNEIFKIKAIDLKAIITGKTTIDIVKSNNNKLNAILYFKITNINTLYLGDEIDKGNDKDVAYFYKNYVAIKDIKETNTFLRILNDL